MRQATYRLGLTLGLALAGVARADAVSRFPVNVNNATPIELIAAGFNLPQALAICIARDLGAPFAGWGSLRDELKRRGLHDCGSYCLRPLEDAKDFVVFSGPTRMPVGHGTEFVKRAREEWKKRRTELGSSRAATEAWLFAHRSAIGQVNVNDATVLELMATGLSLLQSELIVALRETFKTKFKGSGEIESFLWDLEKNSACGSMCRSMVERLRSSKAFVFNQATTLIHPDPERELGAAKAELASDLKKIPASPRSALEIFLKFVESNRLSLPSLLPTVLR